MKRSGEGDSDIVFVGNARCFHTMDWYRTVRSVCPDRNVLVLTDLIDSESHERIVRDDDRLEHLYNIDWLLFKGQSHYGNVWRNLIKALSAPIQAYRLRRFFKAHPSSVYHAHTMYYMGLCWLAGEIGRAHV